jgi:hypothetical protein
MATGVTPAELEVKKTMALFRESLQRIKMRRGYPSSQFLENDFIIWTQAVKVVGFVIKELAPIRRL